MIIVEKVAYLLHRLKLKRKIASFVKKSSSERSKLIKSTYSFENTKERFIGFFRSNIDFRDNVQLFFDVCTGVCNTLNIDRVRQIGCWTGSESKFIIDAGFTGVVEATDFDKERLKFLENEYKGGRYSSIQFFEQDIEDVKAGEFKGVQAVVAQAVLSNIQPEYLEQLFSTMSNDGVEIILIGDCYIKESLTLDPVRTGSHISPVDLNWFHPYMAIGHKHGYQSYFVPDFMYSSFHVARGIFILYKNVNMADFETIMGKSFAHYFSRQGNVLSNFEKVDMNKPYEIEEEDHE